VKDEMLTAHLILRQWRAADRPPFAHMNADPRVMRHFPAPLSRAESDALADRAEAHFAAYGFGPYAAELRETGQFAGYIGLVVPRFEAHFTPTVEIGWRLEATLWNRGLATEGAREVLRYAFEELRLDEVVSFTVPENLASRRVMEKIGLTRDLNGDFDHPGLPEGHPLRRHVLYRMKNGMRKPGLRPESGEGQKQPAPGGALP
jgi:RimJ/RimL family protein N-acetyltransferase